MTKSKTFEFNLDNLKNYNLSPLTTGIEVGVTMGLCSLIPVHPVAKIAIGAVASLAVVETTNYVSNAIAIASQIADDFDDFPECE